MLPRAHDIHVSALAEPARTHPPTFLRRRAAAALASLVLAGDLAFALALDQRVHLLLHVVVDGVDQHRVVITQRQTHRCVGTVPGEERQDGALQRCVVRGDVRRDHLDEALDRLRHVLSDHRTLNLVRDLHTCGLLVPAEGSFPLTQIQLERQR